MKRKSYKRDPEIEYQKWRKQPTKECYEYEVPECDYDAKWGRQAEYDDRYYDDDECDDYDYDYDYKKRSNYSPRKPLVDKDDCFDGSWSTRPEDADANTEEVAAEAQEEV